MKVDLVAQCERPITATGSFETNELWEFGSVDREMKSRRICHLSLTMPAVA